MKFLVAKEAQQILFGAVERVRDVCYFDTEYASFRQTGKRESSAKFETSAITPYIAENGQYGPLLVLECRGLEFTGFDPKVR